MMIPAKDMFPESRVVPYFENFRGRGTIDIRTVVLGSHGLSLAGLDYLFIRHVCTVLDPARLVINITLLGMELSTKTSRNVIKSMIKGLSQYILIP